jgi:uncharacterized membrane protein (DUF2068 family)
MSAHARSDAGVRVVAVLEAAKAAIVLIAGFGLLSAIHHGAAQIAEELARHMHLNPASRYPRVFLDLARNVTNAQLWMLAAAAFGYAVMRSVEALGLWHKRRWAEWFSVASGAVYVPFELVEIARGFSVLRLTTLVVNVGVVLYMLYALRVSRHRVA